jgi:hypothetical protein
MVNRKGTSINLVAILFILGPFIILDSIEIFGRHTAPEELGHFACSILPFTKISVPLVSHQLADFAQNQCATQLHEPALSILFFMLKIALAMTAGVIMGIWIYIIPVWLLPKSLAKTRAATFDRIINAIEKNGGVGGGYKTQFTHFNRPSFILLYYTIKSTDYKF